MALRPETARLQNWKGSESEAAAGGGWVGAGAADFYMVKRELLIILFRNIKPEVGRNTPPPKASTLISK